MIFLDRHQVELAIGDKVSFPLPVTNSFLIKRGQVVDLYVVSNILTMAVVHYKETHYTLRVGDLLKKEEL